jgi:hypothetical protein
VVVELGEKDFPAGLSFVAISQVKTLQGLALHTHFDHACFKKPKEADFMLMLIKGKEHHNQLAFQLDTYKYGSQQVYIFHNCKIFKINVLRLYFYDSKQCVSLM